LLDSHLNILGFLMQLYCEWHCFKISTYTCSLLLYENIIAFCVFTLLPCNFAKSAC
jgi:hypothetical protein